MREKALALTDKKHNEEDNVDYQRLARKMHKGYFKKEKSLPGNSMLGKDISQNEQRKGRRRPTLSPQEKLQIVYAVLIEHSEVKSVAKKYRISPGTAYQ